MGWVVRLAYNRVLYPGSIIEIGNQKWLCKVLVQVVYVGLQL